MRGERAKRIAELNDRLRAALGICCGVPGMAVITRGVAALDEIVKVRVLRAVRTFDAFKEDNDPYREHDFGSIEVEGAGKIFWKIDYYSDEDCEMGSPDPTSTDLSYRVLTIMLAEEY